MEKNHAGSALKVFYIAEEVRKECGPVSTKTIEKCKEAAIKHGLNSYERELLYEMCGV